MISFQTENPSYLDQLSKNITRCGLTSAMLNFLRVTSPSFARRANFNSNSPFQLCEILEPMQELMSRHKTTTFSPRDCLKTILHQRWSKTCSDTRPPAKPRRKRKANATTTTTTNSNTTNPALNKETTLNHSPTPTKKRSPANVAYSQPNQTPLTNNTPGVRGLARRPRSADRRLFRM